MNFIKDKRNSSKNYEKPTMAEKTVKGGIFQVSRGEGQYFQSILADGSAWFFHELTGRPSVSEDRFSW